MWWKVVEKGGEMMENDAIDNWLKEDPSSNFLTSGGDESFGERLFFFGLLRLGIEIS